MQKTLITLFTLAILTNITGCSTLSRSEKIQLRELESYGINQYEQVKSPIVAGVLQILPGVGNFYLAAGTDSSEQNTAGVLNIIPGWLIWPFGCFWAIPQGVIDADVINKKETIYYYTYDRMGKKELQELKERNQ